MSRPIAIPTSPPGVACRCCTSTGANANEIVHNVATELDLSTGAGQNVVQGNTIGGHLYLNQGAASRPRIHPDLPDRRAMHRARAA